MLRTGVNCNAMKRTTLILAGLFMAICASGSDCDKNKPGPVAVTNVSEAAIVSNSNKKPAVAVVGFWEDTEFVVDIFVLATDSTDNNKTHLYVHELIPPNDDQGWKEFVENFTGCYEIQAAPKGSWGHEGDFTRSVSTGSGLIPGLTKAAPKSVNLCGHRKDIKYYIQP